MQIIQLPFGVTIRLVNKEFDMENDRARQHRGKHVPSVACLRGFDSGEELPQHPRMLGNIRKGDGVKV